jgi:hypothetical protein
VVEEHLAPARQGHVPGAAPVDQHDPRLRSRTRSCCDKVGVAMSSLFGSPTEVLFFRDGDEVAELA